MGKSCGQGHIVIKGWWWGIWPSNNPVKTCMCYNLHNKKKIRSVILYVLLNCRLYYENKYKYNSKVYMTKRYFK